MSWRREVRLLCQHSSVARLFPEVWEVWPCNLAFACGAGLVCPVSLCHSWRHLLLVLPFVSLLFPNYFWVFTCQWLLGWCEGIALVGCLRKAGLWNLNSQEAEVSPEPLSFTSIHQKERKEKNRIFKGVAFIWKKNQEIALEFQLLDCQYFPYFWGSESLIWTLIFLLVLRTQDCVHSKQAPFPELHHSS